MKINGEPVAEIDIKASHMTIFHAMVGDPLRVSAIPMLVLTRVGVEALLGPSSV
jgi:hypothetical protein